MSEGANAGKLMTKQDPVPLPVAPGAVLFNGDQRHLLAALMANTADFIYFKDTQSRFTRISRSMAGLFGLQTAEEAIGKRDFDFFTDEHARKAFDDEQAVMRTGVPLVNLEEKETWPDGHATWVSSSKMPLFDPAGRVVGTFGISRDITARKHAEEELQRHRDTLEEQIAARTGELRVANEQLQHEIIERQRAEKALLEGVRMAAIRAMAGGVGIAFSNVIRIIRSYATSIAANFIPKTRVHDEATHILEAAQRGAALTERLMNMARASETGKAEENSPVRLGQAVQEATDFVGEMFQEQNVAIEISHPEAMPVVSGNRAQLVDGLLTFLINAVEAMPGGGTVRLDAGVRRVARPPTKVAAGDFAVLRIRDTGVGMTAAVRKRIFEPFFTTKDSENSFGLGLCYAQAAIQAMGGWIRVSSRPGKGTLFRVYLPTSIATEISAPERLGATPAAGRKARRVLLVDDDPEVLAMMQAALRAQHLKVLVAETSPAGLALYGQHGRQIDISVVDGGLPDSGSARILRRIRRTEPQACVVITSGFSRDYIRGVLPLGGWSFLQKPFDGEQLAKALNDALERNATAR